MFQRVPVCHRDDHHEFPADFNKHARFQNSRQLALRARLGIADFLIEDNDGIFRIETHIALLGVGEVHPLQCLNNFTEAAQRKNIEAGVLIRYEPFVMRLHNYFEGLRSSRQLALCLLQLSSA